MGYMYLAWRNCCMKYSWSAVYEDFTKWQCNKHQSLRLMWGEASVSIYLYWYLYDRMGGPGMWLQGLFWAQFALIGELIRREWTPAEVNKNSTRTTELLLPPHYSQPHFATTDLILYSEFPLINMWNGFFCNCLNKA